MKKIVFQQVQHNPEQSQRIAITGGKGGTGKSTIAILLANKFVKKGKKVVLCDCDVECPNDYLILGQKLKNSKEKIYAEFPKLNKTKCKKRLPRGSGATFRGGLCVKTCRSNAIFQSPGEYPTFIKDLCSACGACWIVCPHGAIEPQKEEVGKIYFNPIRIPSGSYGAGKIKKNYWLVTGRAKPGLEETGPVVAKTKKIALNLAKKLKADYVLFDTAAGTHCPVISALLDCNLAYVVTEPTPMGIYDLILILDLCKKLKVPTKIILNQANLGDKRKIEKIIQRYRIKIEKEIPYSREIVEAYSKGQLLDFDF